MELRRSWIVGLIEAAEKGNRKRQLEAASLAFSNRSSFLTLRHPGIQRIYISFGLALNVTQLRELDKTLVIQDNDEPLAVLLKYEHFLAMQERIGDEG